MRAVVQRVSRACVTVEHREIGAIDSGLCVLLSIAPQDTAEIAKHFAQRIATLRIFSDENGKMNLDLKSAKGSVLVISQFTLHADTSGGHRPSFIAAAPPEPAQRGYEEFVSALREMGFTVATGEFGAHMKVALENDGPVTLVVSSSEPPWPANAG